MNVSSEQQEFVTAEIGGQLFGLPILCVRDVFVPSRLTKVPLAPREVAGILNLRGRIVTIVDMNMRLGLSRREADAEAMAIGIEHHGESYGLLVDAVGAVLKLDAAGRQAIPANLDQRLALVSSGIHRLDGRLLVVLDVDRVLEFSGAANAA